MTNPHSSPQNATQNKAGSALEATRERPSPFMWFAMCLALSLIIMQSIAHYYIFTLPDQNRKVFLDNYRTEEAINPFERTSQIDFLNDFAEFYGFEARNCEETQSWFFAYPQYSASCAEKALQDYLSSLAPSLGVDEIKTIRFLLAPNPNGVLATKTYRPVKLPASNVIVINGPSVDEIKREFSKKFTLNSADPDMQIVGDAVLKRVADKYADCIWGTKREEALCLQSAYDDFVQPRQDGRLFYIPSHLPATYQAYASILDAAGFPVPNEHRSFLISPNEALALIDGEESHKG